MKEKKIFLTLIFAFLVQIIFAQDKTISGTVSDETGVLPGVSVYKKGTSIATETNFNGKYSIKAKKGDIIVFSFVGLKTVEKTIGNLNTINVTMLSENVFDEIVVTGYTKKNKSETTGSVTTIKSESLKDVVTASIDQALQGKVAGVSITSNSGTPGATSSIRIRGISSITAGNGPLYVIDGVPITNNNVNSSSASSSLSALASIDSNNIESITVLKDASSTSQYGARGANGVILITTKSGKKGTARFTFNSSYGFQNDAVKGPQLLTASNRLDLLSEALYNDGKFKNINDVKNSVLKGELKDWNDKGRPEAHWDNVVANKNAPIAQYNISASGGKKDYTYYIGLGFMKQQATVIGSNFKRISSALNFSNSLTKKLKFSTNNTVAYTDQNAYLERSAYFASPRTARVFLKPTTIPYNKDGSPSKFGGSIPNPLILTRDNINTNLFTRIITNNSLKYNFTDDLAIVTRLNIDYQIYNKRTYGNRNYGTSAPQKGEASQYYRNNVTYVLQNYVDYKLHLNEDHKIDFKLLQEYQTNRSYFLGASAKNFADDGLVNLTSAGKPVSVNSSFYDWYVGAYLGLINYSAFNKKYILNLTYRREGNSRFNKKSRWGNFWSIGTAWNINKESFLSEIESINSLKLRASYGVTGNANIDLNTYQSLFSFTPSYGGDGAQVINNYGNDNLAWEKSSTFDIGIDYTLFKNFINGSIGYFNKTSNDLLLNVPLSLTTGFTNQNQNIGELTNKGIEFEMNLNLINTEKMNFSIGGNFSTVKNRITKLPHDPQGKERTITTSQTRIQTGHSVREFYMRTWAGVNPKTGIEEWYVNGKDGKTTSVFNDAKQSWQGANAVPTINASLSLNFDYNGFFVNATGVFAGGNKIYEGWHRYLNELNGYTLRIFNGYTSLLNRWRKPGDKNVRNGKATLTNSPWQRNSKYLYDGDFIRLRTLTVGYNLSQEALKNTGLKGVKLFLKGNNLLTWVKDKNLLFDPEVGYGSNNGNRAGETGLETPPTKIISLGLTLNF